MMIDSYVFISLLIFAVLSSIGSLMTKDNFYSALYMALALVFIASTYALVNLQEIFILIVFIFVGAVGIVTVSLAAVYKFKPSMQVSKAWIIPSVLTAGILSYVFYRSSTYIEFQGASINIDDYLVLIIALVSLMVLLMLSVISISRGD